MITVIAEFNVKPECTGGFIKLAAECTKNTRKEAGNLSYKVYQGRTDENCFTFVEEWANDVAIEMHNAMPHFTSFINAIKPITNGEPSIKQIMRVSQIR